MTATLTCISTGSVGNCYIIEADGERLILELGLPWAKIQAGLGYDLSHVAACLVSHIHLDHTLAIPHILRCGIPVYSCAEVADLYDGVRVAPERFKIGGFSIATLPVEHNVENNAYIIDHAAFGRLLFATDMRFWPYKVKGVTTAVVECDWVRESVLDLLERDELRSSFDNHLSLDGAMEAVRLIKSPKLQNVILIHLSDGNSDEAIIRRRFKEEMGLDVLCADKGQVYPLNISDF